MSLEKLKDSARKFEQKEDWRKAIEVYLKAIQQIESGKDATPDLSLYNRVGDLYLKVGDTASAVRHYERAVELYGDQGFFNNAIALCGKILRVNPGRTQTYLHLARLHARKNVVIEAKRNLLEYLERMNAQGQLDEAFGAVKAFADQFSGSQDIRGMLVELLRAASRGEHASERLHRLCEELEGRGDATAARRPRERHEPAAHESGPAASRRGGGDLVFLDTGFGAAPPRPPAAAEAPVEAEAAEAAPASAPPEGLLPADAFADGSGSVADVEPPEQLGGFEATSLAAAEPEIAPSPEVLSDFDGLIVDTGPGDIEIGEAQSFELETMEPGDDLELERPSEASFGSGGEVQEIDLSDVLAESLSDTQLPAAPAESESPAVELDFIEPGAETELEELPAPSLESAAAEEPAAPPPSAEPPAAEAPAPAANAATPPASAAPPSLAPGSIEALEQGVADHPDDPDTHRALGRALLAAGESQRAADEFVFARQGYEAREAWREAGDMIAQVLQLEPDDIGHYQKLVELAYRTGSRGRMLEAYLALAAALRRIGESEKAIAVYQRVLDHDRGNRSAEAALAELTGAPIAEAPPSAPQASHVAPPPPEASAPAPPRREASPRREAAPREPPLPRESDDFVDLGSLILEEAPRRRNTRMRIEGATPSEDEQKNFEEMLAEFKRGIEENLDVDDYQSHYDLGVAFKEMGLLDEAIAEFQKALRAPEGRLRTSEALGLAFFDKGQFGIAETVLRRGVEGEGGEDAVKIGLLYWLGRSAEAQGKIDDALRYYERALAVDIRFMDLGERASRLAAGRST